MNLQSDCTTPTKKQTKALRQSQRRADPIKRRLEQSSNAVRRRSARTNQTVQEHEQSSNTVQRRSARTNQAVQEHEQLANTVRRCIARDKPGVCLGSNELQNIKNRGCLTSGDICKYFDYLGHNE